MKTTFASAVIAALVSFGVRARAEGSAERVDEATVVSIALATHPTLEAARKDRDAARAAATAADFARVPELSVTARYTRLSSIAERYRRFGDAVFPQILDNLGVRGELTIPLTDTFLSLAAAARAAGHRTEAAEIELTSTRAQIAYDARVAYFTYASRSYGVANAAELVRVAEGQAVDQRRKVTAGTVAPNDALPYETALDSARMGLATAKADAGAAEAMLYAYAPTLRGKALQIPSLEDLSRTLAPLGPAPEMPARLAALEAGKRAAEATHSAVSLQRLPRLSAYGIADMSAPSPRVLVLDRLTLIPTWEVGLRLEWSFSQATAGTAKTAEARHQADALAARADAARRTLVAERDGAKAQLVAAEERIRLAEGRVARATELARARQGELDAGTALPLAVVVAQSDVLRAKNEHVDAAIERSLARAKIDLMDGRVATSGASSKVNE